MPLAAESTLSPIHAFVRAPMDVETHHQRGATDSFDQLKQSKQSISSCHHSALGSRHPRRQLRSFASSSQSRSTRCIMSNLKGSKTEDSLKAAFAGESQANRRYLYFAAKADVEGYNDVAAVFRSTAEGETGHAHGHLEYLETVGDPATGLPFGETKDNLKSAIAGETHEYTDMYPGMAKTARDEGFGEIADWFETLAKAERSHANRFTKALNELG
jgi:rubrerythrin